MTLINETDVYYDPYDAEIDVDPYPVWKRLRDEAPLYYNEPYDFYAVSRADDERWTAASSDTSDSSLRTRLPPAPLDLEVHGLLLFRL